MFRIYTDPIEAASCHDARMVRSRQHLPCPERKAVAGAKRSLESIGSLHSGNLSRRKPNLLGTDKVARRSLILARVYIYLNRIR